MIHLLEENQFKPEKSPKIKYQKSVICQDNFLESIRCHHNEIAKYIEDVYFQYENNTSTEVLLQSIKYYYFSFCDVIDQASFHDIIKYDYYNLMKIIINDDKIDINAINDNKTALIIAIENENIDLVQLLVSNKKIDANVSIEHEIDCHDWRIRGNYTDKFAPLYLSIDKENIKIIKLLLNNDKHDLNCINKTYTYNIKKQPEEGENYDFYVHNNIQDHFYDPCDNRKEYKNPKITTVISSRKTPLFF